MSKVSDRIISWWWFTWPTQRLYNFSYFYLNLAHRVAKEKFLRQKLVYNCQLLSLLPRPWPLVSWDVKFMPSPPGLIFPCGLYAFRITWLDTKPMSKRSLCPLNFFSRGCKIIHLVVYMKFTGSQTFPARNTFFEPLTCYLGSPLGKKWNDLWKHRKRNSDSNRE